LIGGLLLACVLMSGPGRPVRLAAAGVITVTTTGQFIDPTDGFCSLQEAIYSANFDDNVVPSSWSPFATVDSECAAGSGDDIIVLEAGATYNVTAILDDAYNAFGPTATPIVLSNITIEGNGAHLVRNNPNRDFTGTNFRAFAVGNAGFVDPDGDLPIPGDGVGKLTIRNLEIIGFTAKGGNGDNGGGGGLGAGGAIFAAGAELTIESSTFVNNGAGGGNGSLRGSGKGPAGGGGGLGGHGGVGTPDAQFTDGGGGGGGGARGKGGPNGATGDFNGRKAWRTFATGAGGGGTLRDGEKDRVRGFRCGGEGGNAGDGADGTCPGGGGGGGSAEAGLGINGDGGNGNYGGGGGGGGYKESSLNESAGDGGDGGFGGGGGGAATDEGGVEDGGGGGNGGFGAGGGEGDVVSGDGGPFGGNGNAETGGAGAGLGGAIFSHFATVTIRNSTFVGNYVLRGEKASGGNSADDAGGGVFAVDGTLTILNSTFSGNESTGDAAAVMMYHYDQNFSASFELRNTIIVDSVPSPAVEECAMAGGVTYTGSGNLIGNSTLCTGAVSADAKLGTLTLNPPGLTRTMAIGADSAAYDAGDAAVCEPVDQRGVTRPQSFGCDIGAYEFIRPSANLAIAKRALDPAVAGRDLAYGIDVQNVGPTAAENVSMTDTLPSGVSFVAMIAPGFSCSGTTAITCTKGSMSAGEMAALTLR